MVLIALCGGKEGGVDGRVSLKRFGGCSDSSELPELSSPSGVLRIFRSSSSVSVLRGILSYKSSAVILNAVVRRFPLMPDLGRCGEVGTRRGATPWMTFQG